jgi:hypothetical protein
MRFNEIYFSGAEQVESEGFVVKDILRTGEWKVIPTSGGVVNKPLKIVKDGKSNPLEGVISMQELVDNFNAKILDRVQIPLSDDNSDHKNITRLNTGFVRELWIEEDGDVAKLKAKLEFTEPEVKDKVLRGTYADVSCGIPWQINTRGQKHGPILEHVCITNRPFIDGLGPFLAASDNVDEGDASVDHFANEEADLSEFEIKPNGRFIIFDHVNGYITSTDSLTETQGLSWSNQSAWSNSSQGVKITFTPKAQVEEPAPEAEATPEVPPAPVVPVDTDPLRAAQRVREARLNKQTQIEGDKMTALSIEDIKGLELSDDKKAALSTVLEENERLRKSQREARVEARIAELNELGLKDRPGALKLYRSVFLADDDAPAAVLLSDDGKSEKGYTATELLDTFIDALKGESGVVLSDQHFESGNDDRPPADPSKERSVEERLEEMKQALGQV